MNSVQKPVKISNEGLDLVFEPHERAFTMLMPSGWNNQLHLQREHSLNRMLATALSPDRSTIIQFNDSRLPLFQLPNPHLDPMVMACSPHIVQQPYTPADAFLTDYARRFFGSAPGFKILGCQPDHRWGQLFAMDMQRRGFYPQVTSAAVQFEHRGNGPLMHCEVRGVTFMIDQFWQVDMYCINTTGDLREFSELSWRMYASRQTNADVVAQHQRYHAQVMAMGAQQNQFINNMTQLNTQGHNQRMHDIQAWGTANTQMHEARMAQHDVMQQSWMNNQTQFDSQQRSWMNQQVSDVAQQRSRVNAIREEHTAVDANGNQYQVDIHHERYYVNKRDNTYIGTGATTEWHDLRRNYGVNPDDFEEVKIVR